MTIIVLAHERRWTLPSCLANLKSFSGPIILADSSKTPWSRAAEFPWAAYRHLPGMGVYEKFRTIIASAETDLVLLNPDDDFFLMSGVAACHDYMRAHPNVAACMGHLLKFRVTPAGPEIEHTHIGANVSAQIQATRNVIHTETTEVRLARLFDDLVSVNYAVMRREAALKVFEVQDAAPALNEVKFWDKLILFTVGGFGPVAMLDVLYMLRSSDQVVRKVMSQEMDFKVPASAIAERVPADGGALAAYLQEVAGMDSAAASRAARAAVDRVARGYHAEDFRVAQAATDALVQQAAQRQAEELRQVFARIRETYAAPEAQS